MIYRVIGTRPVVTDRILWSFESDDMDALPMDFVHGGDVAPRVGVQFPV